MIRELTLSELTLCLQIAPLFFMEGLLPGEFKNDVFIQTWEKLYSINIGKIHGAFNDNNLCGAIGGIIFPDPNTGDLTATEMFWYVIPDFRKGTIGLKLLNYFENWAIKEGAKRIIMVHLNNLQPERLSILYRKKGYLPIEIHYMKEVI